MSPLFSQKSICRIAALSPAAQAETDSTPSPAPTEAGFHFDADFSRETLGEAIERYLAENGCTGNSVAVGWYDVKSGEEWYHNADTYMEGASIYKLPLSMVYADKIAAGELTEESKVAHYVLRDALEVLIVNSSNAAGRVLSRELGVGITEYRSLLAQYSGLGEAELPERYYRGNQFSPRFLIGTLHTLYDKPEKYALILDLMKQARPDDYFSLYSGGIEVAHKYGSDVGYVCDSGIIYTEHPFLLSVMTHNLGSAQVILGQLARIAMDYAEYLAAQESAPEPEPTEEPADAPAPDPAFEPAEMPSCPLTDASAPSPTCSSTPSEFLSNLVVMLRFSFSSAASFLLLNASSMAAFRSLISMPSMPDPDESTSSSASIPSLKAA